MRLSDSERELLRAALRGNAALMGVICGLMLGGGLWLATAILLLKGGPVVGPHLGLLGVFLPGYSVTWSGALLGLAWGFAYGAVFGALLYASYARTVESRLTELLLPPHGEAFQLPTLLMSGNALGVGLGLTAAVPLVVSTNWLVLRGTAAYSENAALLSHYLPGYSVSPLGSLAGAVQLFAIVFVASHVLAAVYNHVARARGA